MLFRAGKNVFSLGHLSQNICPAGRDHHSQGTPGAQGQTAVEGQLCNRRSIPTHANLSFHLCADYFAGDNSLLLLYPQLHSEMKSRAQSLEASW